MVRLGSKVHLLTDPSMPAARVVFLLGLLGGIWPQRYAPTLRLQLCMHTAMCSAMTGALHQSRRPYAPGLWCRANGDGSRAGMCVYKCVHAMCCVDVGCVRSRQVPMAGNRARLARG